MGAPAIQFKRATRKELKVKIGIDGPSGSGKTDGALALATSLADHMHNAAGGSGRIAVADSENESASYYADRYDFDTVPLPGDVTPRYTADIIKAAVDAQYDVIVIDSLSRVWLNLLAAKDAYDLANPGANRWTTWGLPQFGAAWEHMMKYLLNAPIHVIATMRSKQTHEQIENERGKKQVVKLGLQPQVREGSEYEFGLVFSVNMEHFATASKDRTDLFTGEMVDLRDRTVHKRLIKWMTTETEATPEAIGKLTELALNELVTDSERAAVDKMLAEKPGAEKVAKWTEQLTTRVANRAAGLAPASNGAHA